MRRLCVIILLLASGAGWAAKKPNVVLLFADDLGRYASCYRDADRPSPNDVFRTPHMDSVAEQGTLFENAFVSAPSCTPSRAALLSGRHFFRNGSHAQLHHPWMRGFADPFNKVKGFPVRLQEAGYHIGWTYKLHVDFQHIGGKQNGYSRAGGSFNKFSQTVMKAADREAAKRRLLGQVRRNFQLFLKDRKAGQPFFWWFNPTNTHRAWAKGSGKAIWGIDPDDLEERLPAFLPDVPEIRQDFADYLGEAMAFDAAVGVVVDELRKQGELDDTLLVVSGDHGAPGFPRGKCNLYDFGTRVPLIVRWPGRAAAGRRVESPVSLIDLAPTFMKAAGLKIPSDFNGTSLLAAINPKSKNYEAKLPGRAVMGRELHVNVSRKNHLPYPMRALRTGEYLYIVNFKPDRWPVAVPPLKSPGERRRMDIDFGPTRNFFTEREGETEFAAAWRLGFGKRPAEELYNVKADPHQMRNLADNGKYAAVRKKMRGELMRALRENNDPRVAGEGDAFDRPPYTKPPG